jgi:hypothetical protein
MTFSEAFDALEAAAEHATKPNAEAAAVLAWINETISAGFSGWPLEVKLRASADSCERVAEALAVWFKESAPRRFAELTGTRYAVTGLDCSAEGMERLRDQSEFILLAYPGERYDMAPAELAEDWICDMNGADCGDGFNYNAAEHAIRTYAEESAEYLTAVLESRRQAVRQALADANGDSDGFEPDWPPFRLYVRDNAPESD